MSTTDKDREEARKLIDPHFAESTKGWENLGGELARGKEMRARKIEQAAGEIARIRSEAKAEALSAMAPCIGAYESALKDKAGECTWREDPEGYWSTHCGRSWTFIEGGPIENEISYCHGCGKPVRIADEPETPEQAQKAAYNPEAPDA